MFKKIILACLAAALLLVASAGPVTAAEGSAAQTWANTVAAGNGHFLVVKADGSLWAQGSNWLGQLGIGGAAEGGSFYYTQVKVMDDVTSVSAGNLRSLAVKTDGSLWAWGDNQYGQLGDGTVTTYHYNNNGDWVKKEDHDKSKPVKIMDDVVLAAAGIYHSLAVKRDGSLWAWGDNQWGQIGDGTVNTYDGEGLLTVDNSKSKPVKIMDDAVFAAAGAYYSLAIKSDGSLWAWGYNGFGQLGDGTTASRYAPAKIMDNAVFAAAGGTHSLAIKSDGSLWAWGDNQYGRIGDGTATIYNDEGYLTEDNSRLSPVKIMDDAAFAAAGTSFSLAIKRDGSLWAWGDNWLAQLGNGKVTVRGEDDWNKILADNNRLRPIKIMDRVAAISAGHDYSLAVKKDGSLWGWGNRGTLYNKNMCVPEKVMDGAKVPVSAVPPPSIPEPPVSPPGAVGVFSDVPTDHWAYANIMTLVEKEVISGYADGTFRPNAPVNRSELAKMMTLALQTPLLTNPAPSFADVGENDWEFVYVETAKKYLTGYQQGESFYFKGKEPATREDMAVALVKALELDPGADDDTNKSYIYPKLQQLFSDSDSVSLNLRKYVLTAYEFDLISGYPDGTFGPQKPITRAEAASLLIKVMKKAMKSEVMEKVTFH